MIVRLTWHTWRGLAGTEPFPPYRSRLSDTQAAVDCYNRYIELLTDDGAASHGTRLFSAPIICMEDRLAMACPALPCHTRTALRRHTRGEPETEGSILRLRLRPLAPGAYLRLPVRLRWAVSGNLRGLGVVVFDGLDRRPAMLRPTFVLRPRAVTVADSGPEPEPPDHERSPPERPRPILPIAPLFRRL